MQLLDCFSVVRDMFQYMRGINEIKRSVCDRQSTDIGFDINIAAKQVRCLISLKRGAEALGKKCFWREMQQVLKPNQNWLIRDPIPKPAIYDARRNRNSDRMNVAEHNDFSF